MIGFGLNFSNFIREGLAKRLKTNSFSVTIYC